MKLQKLDTRKNNPKDFVPWGVARGATEDEIRELLCDARDEFFDREAIIILELMERHSVNELFADGFLVLKD